MISCVRSSITLSGDPVVSLEGRWGADPDDSSGLGAAVAVSVRQFRPKVEGAAGADAVGDAVDGQLNLAFQNKTQMILAGSAPQLRYPCGSSDRKWKEPPARMR